MVALSWYIIAFPSNVLRYQAELNKETIYAPYMTPAKYKLSVSHKNINLPTKIWHVYFSGFPDNTTERNTILEHKNNQLVKLIINIYKW